MKEKSGKGVEELAATKGEMEEKITSENNKAEEYKESPLRGIKINLTEATAKVVKDN